MIKIRLVVFWLLLLAFAAHASDTKSRLCAFDGCPNRRCLVFEKNADARMSPASMSKLMTVLMAFGASDGGRITPDDKFYVSDDAWRRGGAGSGGSTMFLKARSRVEVRDLLRGVIVQSGNDACIALAEGLGGSVRMFLPK